MIRNSEVFSIGKLYKPHGVSGEIIFAFDDDIFDRTKAPYWVLEMDGILVPFFVVSYRFRSETAVLVRLEGIESESQAKELANKEVFYPVKFEDSVDSEKEAVEDWDTYLGFKVFEKSAGYLGEITDIDDSTFNVLFKITKGEHEILMPVAEEFITDIDMDRQEMHVLLPEGLLSL